MNLRISPLARLNRLYRELIGSRTIIIVSITAVLAPVFYDHVRASGQTATAPTTIDAASPNSDWDQVLKVELLQTGRVEQLAARLAKEDATAPGAFNARVQVSIEQGNLSAAIALLQPNPAQLPTDLTVLRQLAELQEMVGMTAAAEQSLRAAIMVSSDRLAKRDLTLRLANLLFDDGRSAEGLTALDALKSSDLSAAVPAGVIAYLWGEWSTAARYLDAGAGDSVPLRLLQGSAALKAQEFAVASNAFTIASDHAIRPADRSYAEERLIASARQAGTLPELADAWLAQSNLPAERLLPLATVLRELNRVPELLRWWRKQLTDPARAGTVLSDRFIREILGAAQAARRTGDAAAICREMLDRNPDNRQWLSATVRSLLEQGNTKEADSVLSSRLDAAAESPDELQALGKLAQSLGRDSVAVDAGRRLIDFGGEPAVAGCLLTSSVSQSESDSAKATEFLHQARAIAEHHPGAADSVASALEAANMTGDAIQLLTAVVAQDSDAGLLSHLASLLLEQHRQSEAISILERLSQSNESAALRAQAGHQLLQAASDSGTMDDLIATTRTRLDQGKGDEQDLSLLIDAYSRSKNTTAAADVLRRTPLLLDDKTRLQRLTVLFLRAKDFGQAEKALTQLVVADPAHAMETLERLSSVESNRGDADGATKSVREIEQRIGTNSSSMASMGGILDRLGRPHDAALYYRRALAGTGSDFDTWLLWATAMSKSGDAAAARQRLVALCEEAGNDNLFGVAVDGLLNLNAPAYMLKAARRDAIARAAVTPYNTFLYHIIGDLSDELRDPAMGVRSTEVTVAISDEERPQRLCELMDIAAQNGLIDVAADCGRTLLALGDEFPPTIFLQLAERLLIAGRPHEASRAFSRASEVSDVDAVAKRAGALYAQYGYPEEALKILSPVAERRRDDAALHQIMGNLNEVLGSYDVAFDQYLIATRITIQELPTNAGQLGQPGATQLAQSESPQVELFNDAVSGAMAVARTPKSRAALENALTSSLNERLHDANTSPEPASDVIVIAAALRRVAFAADRPELADRIDNVVLEHWPSGTNYLAIALDKRVEYGLDSQADHFATEHNMQPGAAIRMDRRLHQVGPTTLPDQISQNWAAEMLPAIIVRGEFDNARQILKHMTHDRPEIPVISARLSAASLSPDALPIRIIVAASAAVGDKDLVTQWALLWLAASDLPANLMPLPSGAALPKHNPSRSRHATVTLSQLVVPRYRQVIECTWRLLCPESRALFVNQFVQQIQQTADLETRSVLSLYALELSAELSPPRPNALALASGVLAASGHNLVTNSAQAFTLLPVEDRPEFISAACQRLPNDAKLSFLLTIVAGEIEPLDANTLKAISLAAGNMPDGQSVEWGDWFYNFNQRSVLAPLANAVLRCATREDSGATTESDHLVAAAVALSVAGEQGRADEVAIQAVKVLLMPRVAKKDDSPLALKRLAGGANRGEPNATTQAGTATPHIISPHTNLDDDMLLRLALSAMSSDARTHLLNEQTENLKSEDQTAPGKELGSSSLPLRVILLQSLGQWSQSIDVLRRSFLRDSSDMMLLNLYAKRLWADGRIHELVDEVGPRMVGSNSTTRAVHRLIAQGLNDLFRWREAHSSTQADTIPPDLANAAATNNVAALSLSLRALLQSLRKPDTLTQAGMPSVGGLAAGGNTVADEPPKALDGYATWPGSLDDVLQAIHTPLRIINNSLSSDVNSRWLANLLTHGAKEEAACPRIIDHLEAAEAAGTLTPIERSVTIALATMPNVKVPSAILTPLIPAAMMDDTGVECKKLAGAMAIQRISQADNLRVWGDALINSDGAQNRSLGASPQPLVTLDDSALADWLSTISAIDPNAAERQLNMLRHTGRVTSRFTECGLLWARLAAERGDLTAYRNRLDDLLQAQAWQLIVPISNSVTSLNGRLILDLKKTLPETVVDTRCRAALLNTLQNSLISEAAKWPANTDIVRQLTEVGRWADKHDEAADARTLLKLAKELAEQQGPGEHQLWVADLAHELNDDFVADKIESALLKECCLPSLRIAPLLKRLQAQGRADLVSELSKSASLYCLEPNVQKLSDDRLTSK